MSPAKRYAAFTTACVVAVALANYLFWAIAYSGVAAPEVNTQIKGLAYSPFGRDEAPWVRTNYATHALEADLVQLSALTSRIRTYSSSQFPELPALAAKHKLQIALGLALGKDTGNNAREIRHAIDAARQHANITSLIVGNETQLKSTLSSAALVAALKQVRAQTTLPVTTAEPWHVWLKHPELVDATDFITVHLLTYWEGYAHEDAVDASLRRLAQVRARFPGKKIVIGEVGYPSRGEVIDQARPSPLAQASFVRQFVVRAEKLQLDYFLIEAYDQPWKVFTEGRAGAYWGLFDAARQMKYPLTGSVRPDADWRVKAVGSSLVAISFLLLFFRRVASLRPIAAAVFAITVQGVIALATVAVTMPLWHYMRGTEWLVLVLLVLTCSIMVAILIAHLFEFVELFWPGSLNRNFEPIEPRSINSAHQPFVSIHLACCNEDPNMVIAALKSLQALNYPAFEVLVVDNNTRDDALWQPVQAFVAALAPGARFRFFHLPEWPGFKAGALNFALAQTSPQAELIGVVDADYIVSADWLAASVGHFSDSRVGIVQAPQAHRDWQSNSFKRAMNWEYDGFFRIGMHHRNERNAIIQHGTMTLMRVQALRAHGEWAEWCLCEDAELGLRLMQNQWRAVYLDRVMGEGLTPNNFAAYKKQRQRWAQGGMQILKRHWRALVGVKSSVDPSPAVGLSAGQRYHFLAGWLPWFGDFLHLIFVLMAVAWTWAVLALPHRFSLPFSLFMMPLSMFCITKLLIGPILYRRRVPCSVGEVVGAGIAGMALSHAIARGVMAGLLHADAIFHITAKGGAATATSKRIWRSTAARLAPVREEALLLIALVTATVAVYVDNNSSRFEATLWMSMLMLQALPYAAAVGCAWASTQEHSSQAQTGNRSNT